MTNEILNTLLNDGAIEAEDAEKIRQYEAKKPFSLHWELKTLLYLGVVLLNVGLGILIYENMDSIGHAAIITAIGLMSAVCFWYVFKHGKPFVAGAVPSPTPYFDYVLLLGCLTFLLMEGYWQYQYAIFGTRYGLATFIPMVLFFALAYRFDNRGVLSLAITALASWVGVTVTPINLLKDNDFNSETIVQTGVLLGMFLCAVAFVSEHYDFKKHFSLTYLNFGGHLLMVSCLAGMMALEKPVLYFPLLLVSAAFFFWYARTRASFYFLIVAVVYAYIGATYMILKSMNGADSVFYMLYFLLSCFGIIVFLVNYKRFIQNTKP